MVLHEKLAEQFTTQEVPGPVHENLVNEHELGVKQFHDTETLLVRVIKLHAVP